MKFQVEFTAMRQTKIYNALYLFISKDKDAILELDLRVVSFFFTESKYRIKIHYIDCEIK